MLQLLLQRIFMGHHLKNFSRIVFVSVLLNAALVGVARADDWACEVLLCLSNPKGAMAVAPCVPPIKKLFRELAKGNAFPKCFMGGSSGGSGAQHRYADANYCPAGALIRPQVDGEPWTCAFSGAIVVDIKGKPASRVWWNSESSFTESLNGGSAEYHSRANAGAYQEQ